MKCHLFLQINRRLLGEINDDSWKSLKVQVQVHHTHINLWGSHKIFHYSFMTDQFKTVLTLSILFQLSNSSIAKTTQLKTIIINVQKPKSLLLNESDFHLINIYEDANKSLQKQNSSSKASHTSDNNKMLVSLINSDVNLIRL